MLFSSPSSSLYGSSIHLLQPKHRYHHHHPHHHHLKPKSSSLVCLNVGVEDIAEIVHNKVLVSAVACVAIGQLTKPLTTSILYGEKVNFRRIIGSGGFPSTHTSSVVAAATSLGLERGFSDSIFGMALIFAGIVMYDAQAVRREAGRHAKILNLTLGANAHKNPLLNRSSNSLINSKAVSSTPTKSKVHAPLLPNSEARSTLTLTSENRSTTVQSTLPVDDDNVLRETLSELLPLEESIGHTTTDVIAGAFLGLLVTLSVYTFI